MTVRGGKASPPARPEEAILRLHVRDLRTALREALEELERLDNAILDLAEYDRSVEPPDRLVISRGRTILGQHPGGLE